MIRDGKTEKQQAVEFTKSIEEMLSMALKCCQYGSPAIRGNADDYLQHIHRIYDLAEFQIGQGVEIAKDLDVEKYNGWYCYRKNFKKGKKATVVDININPPEREHIFRYGIRFYKTIATYGEPKEDKEIDENPIFYIRDPENLRAVRLEKETNEAIAEEASGPLLSDYLQEIEYLKRQIAQLEEEVKKHL